MMCAGLVNFCRFVNVSFDGAVTSEVNVALETSFIANVVGLLTAFLTEAVCFSRMRGSPANFVWLLTQMQTSFAKLVSAFVFVGFSLT